MESLQSQNTVRERTISPLENDKSTLNKDIERRDEDIQELKHTIQSSEIDEVKQQLQVL